MSAKGNPATMDSMAFDSDVVDGQAGRADQDPAPDFHDSHPTEDPILLLDETSG